MRLLLPMMLATLAMPAASPTAAPPGATDELARPARLEVAGRAIDTGGGHAAPFVGDFDGDGTKDLLVGQFEDGILWIYRNEGANASPRLAPGVRFKDGAEDGRVPTG